MDMKIGQRVRIIHTGYEGVITSIRIGANASNGLWKGHCEHNPKAKLPDYIEIDNHIQIHPDKVEVLDDT